MIFTCPTGLTVNVRKLKTKELNFLMDRKRFREAFSTPLLDACVIGIENRGAYVEGAPYTFDPGTPAPKDRATAFNWKKATVADQTSALIALYRATYGDVYDFDTNCADPFCKKRIRWALPLSKMPYSMISPETLNLYVTGNKSEFVLQNGTKVAYKVLLTGEDAEAAEPLLEENPSRQLTIALAQRIISVDGVPDTQKLDWLDDLDGDEILRLKEELSKADGGYDTDFLVKCKACELEQRATVPLDRTFFLPARGKSS